MKQIRVYLSTPYTHQKQHIKYTRFLNITRKCAELTKEFHETHIFFSPITHSHLMCDLEDMPHTWDFWSKIDYEFINMCDELWVWCVDGWTNSVGVNAEIKYAESVNKRIVYLAP